MNKRKKSKFALVLMLGICAYFLWTLISQEKMIQDKDKEIASISSKIQEEQEQKQEMEKQKETINSDAYVEKVAREKFGMVKNGERIFIDANR